MSRLIGGALSIVMMAGAPAHCDPGSPTGNPDHGLPRAESTDRRRVPPDLVMTVWWGNDPSRGMSIAIHGEATNSGPFDANGTRHDNGGVKFIIKGWRGGIASIHATWPDDGREASEVSIHCRIDWGDRTSGPTFNDWRHGEKNTGCRLTTQAYDPDRA